MLLNGMVLLLVVVVVLEAGGMSYEERTCPQTNVDRCVRKKNCFSKCS